MASSRIYSVFIGLSCLMGTRLYGYGKTPPAFSMQVGGGLSTYTSETVKSVDTSTSSGLTLESHAGSNGQVIAFLSQVQNTTSFQFTQGGTPSGSTTSFIDSGFLFRWGWLQIGPVWSSLAAEVDQEGTPHIQGTGLGQGGQAAFVIPIRRSSRLFLRATQTSYGSFNESIQELNAATLGSRTDIFIGGRIQLTRSMFSFDVGYRQQTFALTVSGTSTSESIATTWVGLNFHWHP